MKFYMAKGHEKLGKAPTRLLELGDECSTMSGRVYLISTTVEHDVRPCVSHTWRCDAADAGESGPLAPLSFQ
eukprot:700955-Rhodomonas_salina.1